MVSNGRISETRCGRTPARWPRRSGRARPPSDTRRPRRAARAATRSVEALVDEQHVEGRIVGPDHHAEDADRADAGALPRRQRGRPADTCPRAPAGPPPQTIAAQLVVLRGTLRGPARRGSLRRMLTAPAANHAPPSPSRRKRNHVDSWGGTINPAERHANDFDCGAVRAPAGFATGAPAPLRVSAAAATLQPGSVVLLTIDSDEPVPALRARAFDRDLAPFPSDERTWQVLVGIDLDVKAGHASGRSRDRRSGDAGDLSARRSKPRRFPTGRSGSIRTW